MICPTCNIEIDGKGLWFCPHCCTTLNNGLKSKILPDSDYDGNKIIECLPDNDKQKIFGNHGTILPSAVTEGQPKLTCKQKFYVVLPTLIALLITLTCGFINIVAGILVFIITMTFSTILSTFYLNSITKPTLKEQFFIPLVFYCNDKNFGMISIDKEDVDKGTMPRVKRTELSKKNIIAVELDKDNMLNIVHVSQKSNLQENVLRIPDIFSDSTKQFMFY